MQYDFDEEVPRQGTSSAKWEFHRGRHWQQTDAALGDERVLAMWVADMDFRCAQPIVEALAARAQHGIYGYTVAGPSYFQITADWLERRQGWRPGEDCMVPVPGVVPSMHLLVRCVVEPGQKIIIQPPVYHPFFDIVVKNGATLVTNPLRLEDGRYGMDFDDLERKAADPAVRMLLLCNPHNPVGRCWSRAELSRLSEICLAHDVLVVADEIHGDLIVNGATFVPYATISDQAYRKAVICTAPSKTFNLAGLHQSTIIVPDPDLRQKFDEQCARNGMRGVNPFSLAALEAAYRHGEEWLEQALRYIEGNYRLLSDYVGEHLPELAVCELEGTYLAWIDCRGLGLNAAELEHLMFEKARLYFNEGAKFGVEGEGFERINLACPRHILHQALRRMQRVIAEPRRPRLERVS